MHAVTAERDALAKAHAQCEALYAALAAQYSLKANAHPAVATGGYSRVQTGYSRVHLGGLGGLYLY